MPKIYPGLEEFYAESPSRKKAPECDYGVWWKDPQHSWIRWRISYNKGTGEVYAYRQHPDPTQRVVWVLGVIPPDPDDPSGSGWYRTADKILRGWENVCHQETILWVLDRLRQHGFALD